MHEYSVARALLQMVAARADERRARRVVRVHVQVGALSGVVPELLETAWEAVRSGPCGAAALAVRAVPVRWTCPGCGVTLPDGGPLRCVACGGPAELAGGGELLLDRIEMEINSDV